MPERLWLQIGVALGGFVPVGAGLGGVLLGPTFTGPFAAPVPLDSHFRYLSGLLLAIGVAYWTTIPGIERQGQRFQLLTALVVVGGLGRVVSLIAEGPPNGPMFFGLAMELVITPALALWQARLARRAAAAM
jgi:hypothetical protein